MKIYYIVFICILNSISICGQAQLTTPWTDKVTAANIHQEYPRPQMVRSEWQNLNGSWDYAITSDLTEKTPAWDGKILVPFPVESLLSGVEKQVGPEKKLWYHRKFTVPSSWKGKHLLLHFEAVDWETKVWVNGKELGMHQGGYDAFSYDITSALKPFGEQEIILSVWDPSNAGYQPYGKQQIQPRSIWYTATTGIWQTVWLEPVADVHISDFKLFPDLANNSLQIVFDNTEDFNGYTLTATAFDGNTKAGTVSANNGDALTLLLKNAKAWSPDDPFLYNLTISLQKAGKQTDEVKSYFGMRSVSLGKDAQGHVRIQLNGKPVFQYGPLDQGFWPDGLYTAPTDEALQFDIRKEKEMGFNMIRKHVKIESKRWYYWCDKMGMLVWQDMPSGDKFIRRTDSDIVRTAQSAHQYKTEMTQMIHQHFNSPSIIAWVPFNEGWGQFATKEIADLTKSLDSTRLVNATSGWTDRNTGDMHDVHSYPMPSIPSDSLRDEKALVLGEFGGQALAVKDHMWKADLSLAPGHIRTSLTAEDLKQKYQLFMDSLQVLKQKGLAAAVYTQITDVESEVNGLMTYDRRIIKIDVEELKKLHARLIKE